MNGSINVDQHGCRAQASRHSRGISPKRPDAKDDIRLATTRARHEARYSVEDEEAPVRNQTGGKTVGDGLRGMDDKRCGDEVGKRNRSAICEAAY